MASMEANRNDLITSYFNIGLRHKDIVFVLKSKHGITLSVRQLIRCLHAKSMYRYKYPSDVMSVVDFIMEEQRASGSLHGYRWMYEKCKNRGIRALKEEVRLLMRALDPEAAELRKAHRLKRRKYFAKGSNYIWHLDSYDKLKPYGICINGCIDGFSRKMIWLKAYFSSSDPRIVGGYYCEAVEELGGVPMILRGDHGTENTRVCHFQRFLRRNGNDVFHGERSFLYGRSTCNQRIESWWGFLRRECVEFWLEVFDKLKNDGDFDGGFLDKNLVLFCFLGVMQDELDATVEVWDAHIIRPSKNLCVPSGRPNIMFALPELYNTQSYMCIVDDNEVEICKAAATFRAGIPCDEDVYNMCIHIMDENGIVGLPRDVYDALDLYLQLRQNILAMVI